MRNRNVENNASLQEIERLKLAFLPTPIYKLENLSNELGTNIYVKRDDLTGVETSGNKIRKLEYTVAKAVREGAQVLITCGGIQSNHCRATAAVAAKLGLSSHLVLRIDEEPPVEGNYLLDKIFDAEITLISRPDYSNRRAEIMEQIRKDYESNGIKAYVIPEGASEGIGNFGYINAVREVLEQEKQLNIEFDAYVCAVGSGGTYSGLLLGSKFYAPDKQVIGFNVCDDLAYFQEVCTRISNETLAILKRSQDITNDDINIIDGYKGVGYAISTDEELEFITRLARLDGVIFDPVYTGKAIRGLYSEIKKGNLNNLKNILFFHTGGLYGLFPKQEQLAKVLK